MKYVIVYLVRGKVERYHQFLVKTIGPKFGENYLIKNPLPSHITIKSPFVSKNIKNVEYTIKNFVNTRKPVRIDVEGFGNFNRFVAFLKLKFPKQLLKIHTELLNELEDKNKIKLEEFDKKWKPHITIAYGNTKKSFDKIWNELKEKNPKYKLKFDNITILKKPKRYWKIHKIFEIK